MALANILLLSQIAGYSAALVLSLCLFLPLILHQHEFKDHCLLFSTGIWQETDGQFNVAWASKAYCDYSITVGVLVLVISIVQVYRMSMYAYLDKDSSFLSAFIDIIVSILMSLMTLASALIITLGFITWCRDMTERFPSCDIAAGNDIDKKDEINTANFYIHMGTAQFGAWAVWSCWVGLAVLAMIKMCQIRQIEHIRISMFIERQRLMNTD